MSGNPTSTETRRVLAPDDGSVLATVRPDVTEREIVEDRDAIVHRLHAAYLNLTDHMAEFQQQWDEGPTMAFITAAREGWNQGGADWLNDQAELFEKETWLQLGRNVKEFTGSAFDRLATYSKQRYESLRDEINQHVENADDTILNWAWWQRGIEDEINERIEMLQSAGAAVADGAQSVLDTAEKARKVYKHREAIMKLPELIAGGDPKPVQAFVDTVLMDIDPELAQSIKRDPNFAVVLELIADHDSALGYVAYVGLSVEAVPPNFYAYTAGKGGAYVAIEVVLLLVTALLSLGTGVAARIGMLTARFASAGAKAATAGAKIKRAQAAVQAFIRLLEDFSRAVEDLHALGAKLIRARSKGVVLRGNTKTTVMAKRESIKRDKRCRICGSTKHSTPRHRPGTVVYR